MRSLLKSKTFAAIAAAAFLWAGAARAEIKTLICAGDYGMWAQERPAMIVDAVAKVAPGKMVAEAEQSFNFVKKLQAPGYAQRFDVIVAGDIALGQIPTASQESLVKFVRDGGCLIYVMWSKSTLGFRGSQEAEPMPLAAILPNHVLEGKPGDAVADAKAYLPSDELFKGLDFSTMTVLPKDFAEKPLLLERKEGKGVVMALYGAFGATTKTFGYADKRKMPGGWDTWPGLGELWSRILTRASLTSPVKDRTLKEIDAAVKTVALKNDVSVDATKAIDDVRAGNFSMVSLSQLYLEDSGAGEEFFKELNPKGIFDRSVSEALFTSQKGKLFPDKVALFKDYGITGIMMGQNSYGSYGKQTKEQWEKAVAGMNEEKKKDPVNQSYENYLKAWEEKWQKEVDRMAKLSLEHPKAAMYMQPGNEPPIDQGYFDFHNFMATRLIKANPEVKVIGPNHAFNLFAPEEEKMKQFIDQCGANTDVLCWHIYARAPESVAQQVRYWTKYADGKLRAKGPAQVMFTEADAWNTRDSQFNYLLDRGLTFLSMKEILATFQYCIRPRFEGGSYWFGVLFPASDNPKMREFDANYNGLWIFRNLRGKLVATEVKPSEQGAARNCRVMASSDDEGKTVTVLAYYDTGFYDGKARADEATFDINVKLPPGKYSLVQSEARWNERKTSEPSAAVEGQATAQVTLKPCGAASLTWTRQ